MKFWLKLQKSANKPCFHSPPRLSSTRNQFTTMDYQKQAADFLAKNQIRLTAKLLREIS